MSVVFFRLSFLSKTRKLVVCWGTTLLLWLATKRKVSAAVWSKMDMLSREVVVMPVGSKQH